MNSPDNLKFAFQNWLEAQSQEQLVKWLRIGIVAVIMDKKAPEDCFSPGRHLIGIEDVQNWQDDLLAFFVSGSNQLKARFEYAIFECMKSIPGFADDAASSRKDAFEALASSYLWFIRNGRFDSLPEAVRQIERLAFVAFPRSQEIFDASLWTWRLLAPMGVDGKRFALSAIRDITRFRREYAPSVFIGLAMEDLPNLDSRRIRDLMEILPDLTHQIRSQNQPNAVRAFQDSFDESIAKRLEAKNVEVEQRFAALNAEERGLLFGKFRNFQLNDVVRWKNGRKRSLKDRSISSIPRREVLQQWLN
jgi:hypothetical protein